MKGLSVGVDVGGTFTDIVAVDTEGTVEWHKVVSTPADQSDGVMDALSRLGALAGEVDRVAHGTTVATNTLLERSGARVVLCATEGASDLLELGRQERAALYDLTRHHPQPLVAPDECIAVPERLAPEGVTRPLTADSARAVARAVQELRPEIVAVALLHSYANASHERQMEAALHEVVPDIDVVLSSDVLPEIREYERTATTVAEAYLRPAVARYVRRLADRLDHAGHPRLAIMTSSGGMLGALEAARSSAALALSGPAGGVVGAAAVARAAGFTDLLTIDIGGTSADAGLVLDGEALTEPGGAIAGVPVALPRVLVETVSAGGGSIAWMDDGGALRVGPRSAGINPGPAAFGRGGREATVTDAHLVLGSLTTARMSGGVTLDADAARAAVTRLAQRLGTAPELTAEAILAAADAAIARALRRVSVERGVDPRRCVLLAFGGGGPLHACALAERLDMRTILVPPFAGVLSALGLAISPERRESLASVMALAAVLGADQLQALCDALARGAGGGPERRWWLRSRYEGQGHELEVPLTPGEDGAAVARRFASLHARRFGFTMERAVEVVSARHASSGAARAFRPKRRGSRQRIAAAPGATAFLVDSGAPVDATVLGPAVITLPDSTLRVRTGWTARSLEIGGWLVVRAE